MVCFTFLVYTYQSLIRLKFVTEEIYLFTPRTKQLCMRKGLSETQPHCWPRACSLHVVVYKIQKYIASWAVWSLTNLNHSVVGRTCHWLFDYNTRYFEGKNRDAIDLPYIYLTLVSIVLVCDSEACFDRIVRWLSAYPKFVSYLPWQCRALH